MMKKFLKYFIVMPLLVIFSLFLMNVIIYLTILYFSYIRVNMLSIALVRDIPVNIDVPSTSIVCRLVSLPLLNISNPIDEPTQRRPYLSFSIILTFWLLNPSVVVIWLICAKFALIRVKNIRKLKSKIYFFI